MPVGNQFRHQSYPTQPLITPTLHTLQATPPVAGIAAELHTDLAFDQVILVHGTFLGDDPFGISATLQDLANDAPAPAASALKGTAELLLRSTRPIIARSVKDLGNYTSEFCSTFQTLVGDDPQIELLQPTWSGENHHFARADLAVRLIHKLLQKPPAPGRRALLWGHSHAGNAFALLSNLLTGGPAVQKFFAAVGERNETHWLAVRAALNTATQPHPLAQQVAAVTFGTPVRYGWDPAGLSALVHVSFHRPGNPARPEIARPLFPLYSPLDVATARWGDWVQTFAIADTDLNTGKSSELNQRLNTLLETGLEDPPPEPDTRLLMSRRLRKLCSRWKHGTRCHTDGKNLLVDYQSSGKFTFPAIPIEIAALGHGVATAVHWLPAHLQLVITALQPSPPERQ